MMADPSSNPSAPTDATVDQGGDQYASESDSPSVIVANASQVKDIEITLPGFMEKRPEGIFVDPLKAAAEGGFARFVERIFSGNTRFSGLDYAAFSQVLYETPPPVGSLRLAADIVRFAPERQALYKSVKIGDEGIAEYMFEPAILEIVEEVPILGAPDAEGNTQVVDHQVQTRTEPAKLDFDEFVAAMWLKEVRFGLDESGIRKAIESGQVERVEVAKMQEPAPGSDATLQEKTEALHRSDAPQILPDGRVDLKHFKNHFPQVVKDTRIFKKISPVPGKPGRTISGELIEPEPPTDFDLLISAGPGTKIMQLEDGEYIVAAQDGFLNLDPHTSQVSITEMIVTQEDISMRTTGDLALGGDFESRGEVQEHRVVEGRNMTFRGNVFGIIQSHGGKVLIDSNITCGSASSPGGSVTVTGRATMATLNAKDGEITAAYAENSTVVGTRVKIEHAVYSSIIADSVELGTVEGCAIVARSIKIGTSTMRKSQETVVSVLIPDLAAMDEQLAALNKEGDAIQSALSEHTAAAANLRNDPELKSFLALAARIRQGGITLNHSQEDNWQKAVAKFAPAMRASQDLDNKIQVLQARQASLAQHIEQIAAAKQSCSQGINCNIENITDSTLVRTRKYLPDRDLLDEAQVKAFIAEIRDLGSQEERLFFGDDGAFEWKYHADVADDDAT